MNSTVDSETVNSPLTYAQKALIAGSWLIRLAIAAFFAFVGYWKALGPISALIEHHAWVSGYPVWFARSVGWSEIICAVMLITPAIGKLRYVALTGVVTLFINNIVAFITHMSRDELHLTPQNVVIGALLLVLMFYFKRQLK